MGRSLVAEKEVKNVEQKVEGRGEVSVNVPGRLGNGKEAGVAELEVYR